MTTRIESYPSNYLMAVFAVAYAVIAAEFLDISRIPRAFLHRDYVMFEVIFVVALWLCTVGSLRMQTTFGQRSLLAFLGYGLLSGLVSGLLGTIAVLSVSIITRGTRSDLAYVFSWQGASDFAWGATVFSFGWLIGIISGVARFLFDTKRTGWLIAFAVFCILARVALVAVHLVRHQGAGPPFASPLTWLLTCSPISAYSQV
jgi:hypothetical protein